MKSTQKIVLLSLAIALPVLGGGYLLAKKVLWPHYKEYRAARFERSAREFLDQGDYDNAMLFVRKNLAANQQSIPNWRLAAEIAEKRQSPQALYFRRRLALLEPTLENRLQLIRLALDLNATAEAAEAVAGAGPEARDSAEFHELAARTYLGRGSPLQAKFHLITLCELRPEDRSARLDLEQIRLDAAKPEERQPIRAAIRTLAADLALRPRALALLLSDSIRHDEGREALELVRQLQQLPDLGMPESVTVAEALSRYDPPALPNYIARLRQLAADRPADISRLGRFLIGHGRFTETAAWLATLPEATTSTLTVQRLTAALHAEQKDWPALESFLRGCDWAELDFERLALVALAQQQQGNPDAFGETWRLALTAAGTSTAKLEYLLQRTGVWRWEDQRIEVLWRLFELDPRDTTINRQLYAHERAHADTAAINRLFSRILEVAPDDLNAKNNFAYTALLLGQTPTRALNLSRAASTAEPKNASFATTYAFALLRNGRIPQARDVLGKFDALQLWQSERAIILAAILTAAGDPAQAEELLGPVDDRTLLPEEKALLEATRTQIAQQHHQTARDAQIAETVAASRDATSAKSALALLPPALRAKPTLQMELADSLYARDEYAALAKELRTGDWERADFLRLALLAYAQRHLDRTSDARDTWRLAVNTTGTRTELQRVLAVLAGTWNWEEERIDVLARILQREPTDQALLEELAAYYGRRHRTADLARTYGAALAASAPTAANRASFAYYSLLVGTNTSEAHVAAKAAFDQNPADPLALRALAFSLWKQGQSHAGLQLLANSAMRLAPGIDFSLVRALLAADDGDPDAARTELAEFDATDALPEEAALAAGLRPRLAAQ